MQPHPNVVRASAWLSIASMVVTASSAALATTCNIPQACAVYQNAQGYGLSATSAKTAGLYGSTTFEATSSRAYGILGIDASTNKNKLNGGVYGMSPYGVGLYGFSPYGTALYATSTSGFGVRAVSSSNYAVNAASTTYTAVNAVSKSGTGVAAQSSSGTGLVAGSSTGNGLVSTTAGTSGFHAALTGIDASTNSGMNDGIVGIVGNGAWGVEGRSGNGASGGGVNGTATTATGVQGTSQGGYGVHGFSGEGPTSGVYGETGGTGSGVMGYGHFEYSDPATNGTGVVGLGIDGVVGMGGRAFVGTDVNGNVVFVVDGAGDIEYAGSLNNFSQARGNRITTGFTTRSTKPNVEDVGTAALAAGSGTVRFDPAFVASIDARAPYQVFLTPGGDTRGLYVTAKTPLGFVVREAQGGHDNVSFDYRVVAAAVGHTSERMQLLAASAPGAMQRRFQLSQGVLQELARAKSLSLGHSPKHV